MASAAARKTTGRSTPTGPVVSGIRISHPDRLIYPELELSKLQLARYYEDIETWILPHVKGRPLTLIHCPAGIAGPCSYMRHGKVWGPTALRRVRIKEKTKVGEYLVADSIDAVVALAQMGVVEIHTWNSIADDVERPNRIVWDLDPGPEVTWAETVVAARQLRQVLDTLGLASWVKTTGGRGIHVVVPIKPSMDWSACLEFSRNVSEAFERSDASRYTTKFSKRGREAKILIDYLRNNRTNTSVCAYSPRAREGAPVSMPLDWTEIKGAPDRWTLLSVPRRLHHQRADPWADYWKTPQRVSKQMVQAVSRL